MRLHHSSFVRQMLLFDNYSTFARRAKRTRQPSAVQLFSYSSFLISRWLRWCTVLQYPPDCSSPLSCQGQHLVDFSVIYFTSLIIRVGRSQTVERMP